MKHLGQDRGHERFVCQAKVRYFLNRGNRTLVKAQMLGSDKVRLNKALESPLSHWAETRWEKQAWRQGTPVEVHPGEKL